MHSVITTIIGTGSVASGRSNVLLAVGFVFLSGGAYLAVIGRRLLDELR